MGDTLPRINIFAEGNNLDTLWNYLGSIFYLGMPVLLIMVALLLLPQLFDMIIGAVKAASGKDEDDEDDDW